MKLNKIYNGDCLDNIKSLEDKSVNCVITSPPYWQLRDYGYSLQWGLEPTYQEYLEHLWSLMDEVWRVLKDDGTVWVNLGDSYSTQSGTNVTLPKGTHTDQDSTYLTNRGESGNLIKPKMIQKQLLLIPHRFAIGCNDRGWIVRNDIVWAKRNGMPESVTDRFSKKHEYFFLMVKNQKYYFDLDGVRGESKTENVLRNKATESFGVGTNGFSDSYRNSNNPLGKNPGTVSDFWDIPTQPSSEKHYASYNTKLIDKPIIAGCPKGGIILDPFCGTGTTLVRSIQLDRRSIGFDGSEEYCKIANKRVQNELDQYKLF